MNVWKLILLKTMSSLLTTLGSPKDFLWKLDNEYCLYIIREFGKAKSINDKKNTEEELEKIDNYVQIAFQSFNTELKRMVLESSYIMN